METFDITSNAPPTFSLWGKSVSISSDKHIYNQLKYKFLQLAKLETVKAEQEYKKKFSGLDALCINGPEWAYGHFKPAVDLALKELVARDVYDVDQSLFYDTYLDKYECWDASFRKIYDQYAKVVLDETEYKKYRDDCTQNHIRVKAYGFGLVNAVKGAVVAEATNAAIGVGYAVMGKILGGIYGMACSSEKEAIFRNKETKQIILDGIFQTIANTHKSLIDAINERCATKISDVITAENEQKAQRLLSNLKNGIISKEHIENILIDVFLLNHYSTEFYQYAIKEFGDEGCKIEQIADFFMIDVKPYKDNLLATFYASLDMQTIEQAKCAKNQLIEYATNLGINEAKNKYIKIADDTIESLRVKPVRDFLASLDVSSEQKAIQAKSDLISFMNKLGVEDSISLQKIDDVIKTYDIYSRTVCGQVFSTREMADQMRIECAERKKRFLSVFHKYYGDGFYVDKLSDSASHLLAAAIEAFPIDNTDTILCLIDSTLFGSGKKGIAFGLKGVYWCNDWATSTERNFLSWEELCKGEPVRIEKVDDSADIGNIVFAPNCVSNISGSGFDPKDVVNMTNMLIKCFPAPLPETKPKETIQEYPPTITTESTAKTPAPIPQKLPLTDALPQNESKQTCTNTPEAFAQGVIDICMKFTDTDSFMAGSGIPAKKKNNAIKSYPVSADDEVLVLFDTTLFGSAKNGLAIGRKGIYWKNDWATDTKKNFLSWPELYTAKDKIKKDGLHVIFCDGCVFSIAACTPEIKAPVKLFEELVLFANRFNF